jgi:Zn-finger nucleic acid-binding protein
MLAACGSCHRQYDVGSFEPGTRLRCACGRRFTVPAPRPRQAKMMVCSQCGGTLAEGWTDCEYCGAALALGERGLGETCPECFARMVKDARYCSSCGVAIRPESILKALSRERCPRCEGTLASVESQGRSFVECVGCGGLWLDESLFTELTRARDRSVLPPEMLASSRRNPAQAAPSTVRYLPCPVCGELMHRRNFAGSSGVVIDWCKGHGFWFDAHELERIADFVEAGGLERARERRREPSSASAALFPTEEERRSGASGGFLDLLSELALQLLGI